MVATATGSAYLYAITSSAFAVNVAALSGVGSAGSPPSAPRCVAEGPLTVVIGGYDGNKVRPERRNLAAHQGVLRALMDQGVPFLPVAFGVVVPSAEELLAVLRANQEVILLDLERLAGKVEMGLKVVWDVPNIFEFFVFRNAELARLRDSVLKKPGGPSHGDKISLGQAFDALLNATREEHAVTLTHALEGAVLEVSSDPPRDETMVLNAACLIPRDGEKAFEAAVLRAAESFDDNYKIDYSGPWPPYHFVKATLPSSAQGLSN